MKAKKANLQLVSPNFPIMGIRFLFERNIRNPPHSLSHSLNRWWWSSVVARFWESGLLWWLSTKESACQCRRPGRHRFNPWFRKIPWRRACQPPPVFWPGESHGQRSLAGYSSVQFSSVTQSHPTLCNPTNRSTPGLPVHHQLPEFTQTHVHRVGDAIQPSHPLSHPSPPAPNPPSIRVFSSESTHHIRWPKYWNFSFSISPTNEHPGLISFRMNWLDLLAVQGTLKSLLQYHSSKASILWRSAFFTVQLSNPFMTTGKTTDLIRWTFVGKVMCLLFNTLSRLVITFLPRSKRPLISWRQSPSPVILDLQK